MTHAQKRAFDEQVAFWRGEFGDEYTARNALPDIAARKLLWAEILECFGSVPRSYLEIGAGGGGNLQALRLLHQGPLLAVEPNEAARRVLGAGGVHAVDGTAASPGLTADLAFTSGVLIHVHPHDLGAACDGIYAAAERYIVSIEYFSERPEEIDYRGHAGKLWKRDFGSFWLDRYPELEPLGCGFAWRRTTGLDNLTYWAFQK